MSRLLRILFAEGNVTDAELIVRELRFAELASEWRRMKTEAEYLTALDEIISSQHVKLARPELRCA